MDRRLVDHLVNSELVSRASMQRMILRASKAKTGVVEQLLADDKLDEDALASELASYYGLGVIAPGDFSVSDTALKFISKTMADKHGVLPYAISDSADHVTVAVYNPEAAQSVVESLKTATGKEPTVKIAPKSWLDQAIRHFYFGEAWAAAPAHRAATREVGDVEDELEGIVGTTEESSEIVLDEVIMPPRPRKNSVHAREKKNSREPPSPDLDLELDPDPQPPQPSRRRKASSPDSKSKRKRSNPRAAADSEAEVEAALDDFDAFLDSATGWGTGTRNKIPGWDDEPQDENPFTLQASAAEEWSDSGNSNAGFNLFDEKSEPGSAALHDRIDEHEQTIERLRRELQQQRDIISALVEALADAGVVSKREIKHRVKRK